MRASLAMGPDTMWQGYACSAMLHAIVVLLLAFGLPQLFEPLEPVVTVPVSVITPEELAQQQIEATPLQEAEAAKEEPAPVETVEPPKPQASEPPPPAAPKPLPPTPPAPEPPPAPTAAASPPQPVAEPPPAPAPEPEPAPAALPEPAPTPAPEPKPAPEPDPVVASEPEAEKPLMAEVVPPAPRPRPVLAPPARVTEPEPEPQEDRLTSILRNVQKDLKPVERRPEPRAETPTQEASLTARLQAAELARLIQGQVERCWRIDAGAQDAQDLVVRIRVRLNPDGSVIGQPDFMEVQKIVSDPFYRSAAENARRAILECAPFDLPYDRYDLWRDLVLNFNPREMF